MVPSLVQLADPSFLISPERSLLLTERGFEVRSVAGAGHTIHRDDFEGFMSSLEGWIQAVPCGSCRGRGAPSGSPFLPATVVPTDR